MGVFKLKKYFLFYIAILLVGYQNCSPLESSIGGNNSSSVGDVPFAKVKAILDNNCVACHSSSFSSGDVNLETYSAISMSLVPGDAQSSLLYQVLANGVMPPPPTNPLSAADLAAIEAWIDQGALEVLPDPDPIPDPDPDPDPTPTNVAPTVNAGANKSITLPTSTTTITGTATDSDGTIASRLWTTVSGPATAVLTNATTNTVSVSGLSVAGNYVFQFSATDDDGATSTDQVTVNVIAAAATVTYDQVAPIFASRCTSCHSGANPSGGFNISTYNGAKTMVTPGVIATSEMWKRVSNNIMPPGSPLSANQKNTIRDWIIQGAAN